MRSSLVVVVAGVEVVPLVVSLSGKMCGVSSIGFIQMVFVCVLLSAAVIFTSLHST